MSYKHGYFGTRGIWICTSTYPLMSVGVFTDLVSAEILQQVCAVCVSKCVHACKITDWTPPLSQLLNDRLVTAERRKANTYISYSQEKQTRCDAHTTVMLHQTPQDRALPDVANPELQTYKIFTLAHCKPFTHHYFCISDSS